VSWFDRTPALILAALIVILGLQPGWMVRWSETTTATLMPTRSAIAQIYRGASRVETIPKEYQQ
jgi:NAD(P)H-quinone oxidoreductase subunit 4